MSRHDLRITLDAMRSHAEEAVDLCAGKSYEEVQSDRVLSLALVRLIQIVGEAATRVPVERRETWPQIEWPRIIGTRNRLVHGYEFVDLAVVWTIIQDGLPDMLREIKRLLESDDLA